MTDYTFKDEEVEETFTYLLAELIKIQQRLKELEKKVG